MTTPGGDLGGLEAGKGSGVVVICGLSIGWGGRQRGVGGNVGVQDVQGSHLHGNEVEAVIPGEIHVGFESVSVQVVEVYHLGHIVHLDCILEH